MRKSVIQGCANLWGTSISFLPVSARSVEDETRNGDRNANQNPNRNHETIVLGLFSIENLKRAIKR